MMDDEGSENERIGMPNETSAVYRLISMRWKRCNRK